ncbi:recombination protein RecR [Candidatus Parcubacteria bacterium]|nr:recombination protein RecR [Candidatus Parcubacteria bacterium]
MNNYPPSIQKLIDIFSSFPTVGPRTAARFVFYLMRLPEEKIKEILDSVSNLKKTIKICSFCFSPFQAADTEETLCPICQNKTRNRNLLCIIEKETDLVALEKTKKYNGLYFILGGTVSKLKEDEIRKLRAEALIERIKNPEKFGISGADFQEIIIAFNPTAESEATALYLKRLLKPLGKKITQLGRGLPIGGELEYADQETLSSALESRR